LSRESAVRLAVSVSSTPASDGTGSLVGHVEHASALLTQRRRTGSKPATIAPAAAPARNPRLVICIAAQAI
jgi:hypothetical protein